MVGGGWSGRRRVPHNEAPSSFRELQLAGARGPEVLQHLKHLHATHAHTHRHATAPSAPSPIHPLNLLEATGGGGTGEGRACVCKHGESHRALQRDLTFSGRRHRRLCMLTEGDMLTWASMNVASEHAPAIWRRSVELVFYTSAFNLLDYLIT